MSQGHENLTQHKKASNHHANLPWKCTVLHCNHLGNTWKPLVLMTWHFDYCPSTTEGDNQSARSSAPVVSRCFPGGYNVKLYISRGRLAWWLLAFLHSVMFCHDPEVVGSWSNLGYLVFPSKSEAWTENKGRHHTLNYEPPVKAIWVQNYPFNIYQNENYMYLWDTPFYTSFLSFSTLKVTGRFFTGLEIIKKIHSSS